MAKTMVQRHYMWLVFVVAAFACCRASGDFPAEDTTKTQSGVRIVWTWGGNMWGELGHKEGRFLWPPGGRYKPTPITEVGSVIEIAAGDFHTMALDSEGHVWTWGDNSHGQLGIGSKSESGGVPRLVPGLEHVRAIAAGTSFSLAVLKDGTVYAWGANNAGQLGNELLEDQTKAIPVFEIDDVKSIAAGGEFAVALKNDGTVWAWGYNGYGQLGDGTKENRTIPIKMPFENVKAIACGDDMTLALKEDGTVWGCGFNWYGNLGDGSEIHRSSPVQIKELSAITAIACGNSHSLAIKKDGTAWAWGFGYRGELGLDEEFSNQQLTAIKIPGLKNIMAVEAGEDYSLALDNDSTLWAWGRNWNGQFGVSKPRQSLVPIKVSGILGIEKISCGVHHTVAIRSTNGELEGAREEGKQSESE